MTKEKKNRLWLAVAIILAILIIDQVIKILVKTHMHIGESIPVFGSWFQILFIENEGMAFGMHFGGSVGKILLSVFRLVASVGIAWGIVYLIKKESRKFLLVSLALVFAGAVGNIIDSCFYGLIFSESSYEVATMFPEEGGYAPFLFGKVVDMFYFPIIDTTLPNWVPIWGGQHFTFFNAIFNFADAAITIGIFMLVIDQLFSSKKDKKSKEESEKTAAETTEQSV
ncbi:MAG: lipoprotein signal peptidase [Bacteroidales bacterium]|nr:lipoprotein signal peptidase [Bacteroidales bacterium]